MTFFEKSFVKFTPCKYRFFFITYLVCIYLRQNPVYSRIFQHQHHKCICSTYLTVWLFALVCFKYIINQSVQVQIWALFVLKTYMSDKFYVFYGQLKVSLSYNIKKIFGTLCNFKFSVLIQDEISSHSEVQAPTFFLFYP